LIFSPQKNSHGKTQSSFCGGLSLVLVLLLAHDGMPFLYKKIVTTRASKSFRNRLDLNWKPCERRERKQEKKGILRNKDKARGVSHTLKRILRQKKNYGNSNISPCKNIIFKKSSKRNQNRSRDYNL
jgi:hypothetical protein